MSRILKKMMAVAIATIISIVLLPINVYAVDVEIPSITMTSTYNAETNQITVKADIAEFNNIAALGFSIGYDATKLTATNLLTSGGLQDVDMSNTVITDADNAIEMASGSQKGVFTCSWTSATTLPITLSEGNLVTLVFNVNDNVVGTQDIKITYLTVTQGNVADPTDDDSYEKILDPVDYSIYPSMKTSSTVTHSISTTVALSGSLTVPTKGGTDTSSFTGTNVAASVSWSPVLTDSKFVAGTVYTATVTVTPAEYYSFGTGASVTAEGLSFKKSGDNYVASKEFAATESKSLSSIFVTKNPTKMIYVLGEKLDTAGMEVTGTYDDNSTGLLSNYSITYQTGTALSVSDTEVTITVEEKTTKLTGLTVNKKDPDKTLFTITDPKLIYTGTDQLSTITSAVTASGNDSSRGLVTYTVKKGGETVTDATDAGNYELYATVAGGTDYNAGSNISLGTIKIAKKAITANDFTVDTTGKDYTALEIKPTVSSVALTLTTDYTVEYSNNVNSGDNTGTITITAAGNNYSGTVTEHFTINPIILHTGDLESTAANPTKVYDGTTSTGNCNPAPTVQVKASALKGDDTLTIAGTYLYDKKDVTAEKIIFTPTDITTGNYRLASTETVDIAATITPLAIVADTTKGNTAAKRYDVVIGDGAFTEASFTGINDEIPTGTIVYTYKSGTKTYDQIKAILAVLNDKDMAEIGYQFTGSGNYANASVSGTIYLRAVDITFTVDGETATSANTVTKKSNLTYGDDWADIIKIKSDSIDASVGADSIEGKYSLSVSGLPNAGEQLYEVLFNSTNGFYKNVVVCSETVTIAKKDVQITGLSADDKIYDGKTNAIVKGTSVIDGALAADGITVSIGTASFASKDAAKAITVSFSGYSLTGAKAANYNLTEQPKNVKANITPKPINAAYVGQPITKVYDKNTNSGKIAYEAQTGVEGDTITSIVTVENATYADPNVGTQIAIAAGEKNVEGVTTTNYTITYPSLTGSITAKPVEAIIKGTAGPVKYGTNYSHYVEVLPEMIEGDSSTMAVLYSGTEIRPTSAGTYALTAKMSNTNYQITGYTDASISSFTIAKADPMLIGDVTITRNSSDTSLIAIDDTSDMGTLVPGTWTQVTRNGDNTILATEPSANAKSLQYQLKENVVANQSAVYDLVFTPTDTANYNEQQKRLTISTTSNKQQDDLNFPVVNKSTNYGTEPETVPVQGAASGAALTYTSSNPDVVSVDPNTGKITYNKPGTVVITVTSVVPGYDTKSVSYQLNVQIGKITVRLKNLSIKVKDAVPVLSENSYSVEGLKAGDSLVKKPNAYYVTKPDTGKTGTFEITASEGVVPNNELYDTTIEYVKGILTISSINASNDDTNARTCQDDGYPAGYVWSDAKQECIGYSVPNTGNRGQ